MLEIKINKPQTKVTVINFLCTLLVFHPAWQLNGTLRLGDIDT